MSNDLFSDPVSWSGVLVRTRTRFLLTGLALSVMLVGSFFNAARPDLRPLFLSWVLLPAAWQIMLLYALRRLYVRLTDTESTSQRSA